jgi:hypothetical protein
MASRKIWRTRRLSVILVRSPRKSRWRELFSISEIEVRFDPLKPSIHLRLQGLAAQIIAAQRIDVLAYLD